MYFWLERHLHFPVASGALWELDGSAAPRTLRGFVNNQEQ
jgi:hypothetical protein